MEPVVAEQPPDDDFEPATSPREFLLFGLRAAQKNWALCLLVAVGIIVVGCTVVAAIPPIYDATCKVFIQDGGSVTAALASGRERYRPLEGSRGLEESLLARDNLVSISREAGLAATWPTTRAAPMKVKDRVMELLRGPPSAKDMERGFVEMLSKQLIGTRDGESVRINGQWRNGQNAYDITRLALRNWLAARAAHDLGPIQRAIPFLETQLQEADQAIESAVSRMQTREPESAAPPVAQGPATETRPKPASTSAANEFAALSRQLSQVRRDQRELVEPWRNRIMELKVKLVDLKASYAEDHPLVRQQEARIEAANEVPEDLAALRAKEAELVNALGSHGAGRGRSAGSAGGGGIAPTAAGADESAEDAARAPAQARLFAALRKSDDIAARLENARIELATAEADFAHRYVVVEQPELPQKPLKDKRPLLFLVVFVASIIVGALAGVGRELLRGQLTESWQVRSLGLPLLGDADLKKLLPGDKP